MLNIVIIGAPGCGKGKHSTHICKKYELVHISTGDILREEIELHTELGESIKQFIDNGYLVPFDIVTRKIIVNSIKNKKAKGFLFDGYPRTLHQAEILDALLKSRKKEISLVLSLDVEEIELYRRILHRSEKSRRTDDTEEVIKNRLKVYQEQTLPLLNYYDTQGKLYHINGMAPEEVVFERISKVIDFIINKKN